MSETSPFPVLKFPAIQLLFLTGDLPTPGKEAISDQIQAVEPVEKGRVTVAWDIQDRRRCLGKIHFDDHEISVAGLPAPLPEVVINHTIHTSHWQPQIKTALRNHLSHLGLVYMGNNPDPVEKMIALYKAAACFKTENLLGVVNEGAWTAHPSADFLDPARIRNYREEIPFIIWMGYVKFFEDKEHYWLATRGHHIFDVPDLAHFMLPGDENDAIINQFINIFYYIYEEDAEVTTGDTLAIKDTETVMKFAEVPEDADFLMGPIGTLVIETVPPADMKNGTLSQE